MGQLHFYVTEEVAALIRKKASQAKMPPSRYLADLVTQAVVKPSQWPMGYFEQVFGQQGELLSRAPQGEYEART